MQICIPQCIDHGKFTRDRRGDRDKAGARRRQENRDPMSGYGPSPKSVTTQEPGLSLQVELPT